MKQSNFKRNITDFPAFAAFLEYDSFLNKIYSDYVRQGKAMLTFRNDEATIYYNGNQLCNVKLAPQKGAELTIYERYLPLVRSKILSMSSSEKQKAGYLSEQEWLKKSEIDGYSFCSMLPEILSNIEHDSSPESIQVSRLYHFSPLSPENHEIVLLDVEAAFSYSSEQRNRIDAVFYHTGERRLMFVEVKRLSDTRVRGKKDSVAEVIGQLKRYQDTIKNQKINIIAQYDNVIKYFNALSGRNIPTIADYVEPLLGLLLVECSRNKEDMEKEQAVIEAVEFEKFKVDSIGSAGNASDNFIARMYRRFEKI